jgi:hypothetical protein
MGPELAISAHPVGAAEPVVTLRFPAATSPPGAYPSTLDVPTAGCWHLDVELGGTKSSLEVLVAAQ